MSVPTHGPDCISKAYKTRCPDCGNDVFFFTCNCGTKIFFDDLGYPWPEHHCRQREIRDAIHLIRQSERLTDDEIFRRIEEYGKKHGRHISREFFEIIDNELTRRRKEFKCLEIEFNENIKGLAGQITGLNKDINFAKRFGFDHTAPFIKDLLGELSKAPFTEIIIRDNPDKNNHSRQYSVFIKSAELKLTGIHLGDMITVRVRESKSLTKVWVVSNIQKI